MDWPILGKISEIQSILKKYKPDEVWIADSDIAEKSTGKIIRTSQINHVQVKIFPNELELDLAAVKVSTFKNLPIITLLNSKLEGWGALLKSFMDICIGSLALLILSPLLLFIALKIWFTDRTAPIFYRSQRIGKNGQSFWCCKFRTMVVDADAQKKSLLKKNERKGSVLFKINDDPRITPFGKILRQYSLDELPQLWNVLKRDMSLIGPRPHLPEEVKRYPKEHLQILSSRPGITGFSQINGSSDLSFEEEMKHETFYIKNWSPWLDIIIFFKSILVVVKGRNR